MLRYIIKIVGECLILKVDYNIIKIGNYVYEGSQCGLVIGVAGMMSALAAGVHGYVNSNILIIKKEDNNEKR